MIDTVEDRVLGCREQPGEAMIAGRSRDLGNV